MKVIFPVSEHDLHLAEDFAKVVAGLGPYQHKAVFVPTKEVAGDDRYKAFVQDIGMSFISYEEFVPQSSLGSGWPNACNAHFAFTVNKLTETGNKEPFFWCEQDCNPRVSTWIDDVEAEYKLQNKPFLGKMVDTPFRTESGDITTKASDKMLMGCAVYPPFIHRLKDYSALFASLGSGQCMTPWDVFLRWFMRNAGWGNTDLIGDRWNTIEYKDGFKCKPNKTEFKFRDHSETDISGASIIHGCKDGSLARLILKSIPERVVTDNLPESGDDNVTRPNSSVSTTAGAEGAKKLSSIHTIAAGGGTGTPAISFPNVKFILKKINEKSIRLKDLMRYFDLDLDTIHDFTKYLNENGLVAKAPAYWVKEK